MPRPRKAPPASPPGSEPAPPTEFELIARLRGRHPGGARGLVLGIGDDAAVFRSAPGSELLITSDLLVEDIDFRLADFRAGDIGHKAVAASLSDVAAMGGRPRWVLLSLGVPRALWERPRFVDDLHEGAETLARRHGAFVIGGDISRTPERVVVDATLVGEVARGRSIRRRGARPGDQIFVTGTLGGAAGALRVFEHARSLSESSPDEAQTFSRAHSELALCQTRPSPRVEWGEALGEAGLATAMIDLSDGLSSDLAHLCRESDVGALVEAERLPVNPLLRPARVARGDSFRRALRRDALRLALHGGEDFELLFTVSPRDVRRLPRGVGGAAVTRVGEIREAREGVKILRGGRETRLAPSGFEHF